MKYLDGYRDPRAAEDLLDRIGAAVTRPWTLAEVCGGQAHHLLRFGTERALPGGLELLHGPGCPVSSTTPEAIDLALDVASRGRVVLCTSGDLLRVPGRRGGCLADAQARQKDVRVVYSPLDALALARQNPDRTVVFFGVGFETTAPTAAAAVREADRLGLDNFALLPAHRRLAPAVEAMLEAHGGRVQAVLTAGHVATVTGLGDFEAIAARRRVPVVVIGPEPLDLLEGLWLAVRMLERGEYAVANQYARAVRPEGNPHALAAIDAVFEPTDAAWPGLGLVPRSGLGLRERYRRFDALTRFPVARSAGVGGCSAACGGVVSGRVKPHECREFQTGCVPDRPLGAPMASPEGACAAYHRYRGRLGPVALPSHVGSVAAAAQGGVER